MKGFDYRQSNKLLYCSKEIIDFLNLSQHNCFGAILQHWLMLANNAI